MGDRFASMEMAEANNQCSNRKLQQRDKCPKCDSPVIVHCAQCMIQVTGCVCTEVDRFGSQAENIKSIYDRMAGQVGPDEAKRRLIQAGFWVPKGTDLN